MTERTQRNNITLAFITLVGVVIIVSVIGFFTFRKGTDIIQGQAEATEYRVSSKVPGRILKFFVSEGDQVKAGDTLAILEAPDVMAKLSQAQALEQAAQALNEKAERGTRAEQLQAAYEMWQKAKAGKEIAEKSYQRVNRLYEEGVMSAQKRDEAKAQYDAMTATERRRQTHGASQGKASRRGCSRSEFVHQRNVSDGICRRGSDGDIPQGRRTGRNRSTYHERSPTGRYVGNIQCA